MKTRKIITTVTLLLIMFAFSSCNKIPKEPSKGATEFLDKMKKCSNLQDAEQLVKDYLNAYDESERIKFFYALINEVKYENSTVNSDCLTLLSEAKSSKENPYIFEFMRYYLAVKEVKERNNKNDVANSVLPTQNEIDKVNEKLPIEIAEGTLLTEVTYDSKTMIQTFNYAFTQEIDSKKITSTFLEQRKNLMMQKLLEEGDVDRLQAGVKYNYVYKTMDGITLYHIVIDFNDLHQLKNTEKNGTR